MNKLSKIVLLFVIIVGSKAFAQTTPSSANAQDMQKMMRAHYGTSGSHSGMYPGAELMTKEKITKLMQSMFEIGLLYKMIEQPTMVSVDDGVIVAFGNTIRKYDKELNVVKEVKLDMNVDSMQGLASKFAKKYSAEFMDLMGQSEGLAQAKMTSNDALAKATLRAISTAAESYATANGGQYPTNEAALTDAKPPYLNTAYCASSPVAGFYYDCSMSSTGYTVTATPMTPGSTGSGKVTITTGGVLTP